MLSIVREYGYLSSTGESNGLDFVRLPDKEFNSLQEQALNWPESLTPIFRLRNHQGYRCLQVLNYVGLIETPNGYQVEILPKVTRNEDSIDHLRRLLRNMLTIVFDIKYIDTGAAKLGTLPQTWLESLIELFLVEVTNLVHKGIKKQYQRIISDELFLKGQLNISRQVRKQPHLQYKFNITYDSYLIDRPENRLLKLALEHVGHLVKLPKNQRLVRELLFHFDAIPKSINPIIDFNNWSNQRDMITYQYIKPWIELILNNESPIFSSGKYQGLSLLFPMEQLFEDYVTALLRRQLQNGYRLTSQAKSKYLVTHRNNQWFNLNPDILITKSHHAITVLDAKWKLLSTYANDSKSKYNISQSDMYQLYAYGNKYLGGKGSVYLIYPAHSDFTQPPPPFHYDDQLKLWAVPFDLDQGKLIKGEWYNEAPWLRDNHIFSMVSNQ